ncbi:UDP-glucuronic acid dehydrogenase [Pseudomonas aeruginosa]|uniref:UDP-glucuronic acid dehydrogenase n=1 Tax=Pseudomonas aeruginosa TaxID=287 RepID=UPI0024978C45|nr:UDP-glucuronic acid dehydrogenase [Pseudomonas aeruginosa]MDI2458499.1 UDP-glucuronic acid dehydrogenase [Pseudomonas aeruginosa]
MSRLKVTLMCSDPRHPVNRMLDRWREVQGRAHEITVCRKKAELPGGDILFLISCSEIIREVDRSKYSKVLVLHASDLPKGRGWSPHIWELAAGAEFITLSLLEAAENVDGGAIWSKEVIPVPVNALYDEINDLLFQSESRLMDFAILNFATVIPQPQSEEFEPTYYRRRVPEDSELDPKLSLAEQFNLLRVCDPQRFPAYFKLHGHKYKIVLEKLF